MPALASQFKAFDDISKAIDNLVGDVAKEVFVRIYNRTPVDTGYAQSRWMLDINTEDFLVSNDCEYISYLENGHSKQAPYGMVAVTLNEIDNIVNEVAQRAIK